MEETANQRGCKMCWKRPVIRVVAKMRLSLLGPN